MGVHCRPQGPLRALVKRGVEPKVDLTCAIRIPPGVRTGISQRYTLRASENVGTGFLTVPAVRGTADPEVIHFR
jgi:hypothetical protein